MNIGDLNEKYLNRVIVFKKGVDDLEAYPEEGMKARISMMRSEHDGEVIKMTVDFSEFDEHNEIRESSNYYDSDHNPVLTAREAGLYTPIERLYLDGTSGYDWSDIFEFDGDLFNFLTWNDDMKWFDIKPGYSMKHLDQDVVSIRQRAGTNLDVHCEHFVRAEVDPATIEVYQITRVM